LASCSRTPTIKPLSTTSRIVAFGDSLTFGTGAESNLSYPSQLSNKLNIHIINEGIPGETSEEGLTRLPSIIAKHQPQLLIICHGGNDILRKYASSVTETNIRNMVKMAKQHNIDVVLVAVSGLNLWAKPSPLYANIAEEFKLPLEESIIQTLQKNTSLKSDHVHFNGKGYGLLADAIENLLKSAKAIDE